MSETRPRRRPRPDRRRTRAQRAGHAHADQRAERQAQQRDAEGGVAGADGGGDVGHADAQLPKTAPSSTKTAVTARAAPRWSPGNVGHGGNRSGRQGTGIRTRRDSERGDTEEPLGGTAGHPRWGWPRRAGRAHDLGHPRLHSRSETWRPPVRHVSFRRESGHARGVLSCCASRPRWRCRVAGRRTRCPRRRHLVVGDRQPPHQRADQQVVDPRDQPEPRRDQRVEDARLHLLAGSV